MHTPGKKIPSKNLSPRYGQLKNYFLLWEGLRGAADRGTAALVNHTVRVEYGEQEMCCSWPHSVLNDQLAPTCPWSFT